MKNLIKSMLFVIVVSCQSPEPTEEIEKKTPFNVDKLVAMNAVSKAEAKRNIDYFAKNPHLINRSDPIKAFTVSSLDLYEAAGFGNEKEFSHVRIYVGLDSLNGELKLYLTPVKGANLKENIAGRDVYRTGKYKGDGLGDDGPYLLDFSKPCPTTCPDDPL